MTISTDGSVGTDRTAYTSVIVCKFRSEGCDSVLYTSEAVSPNVEYTCRKHFQTKKTASFQEFAHETDTLDRAGRRKRQAKATNEYFRDENESKVIK